MSWQEVSFEALYSEDSRNGVYKPKEYHGSGVRVVNMGELFGYDRIGDQPMRLLQLTDHEMEKSSLQDGDLLFGRRSLVEEGAGKCSLVFRPTQPMTFESSIIRVRLDQEAADPHFYYYYFKSSVGRSRVMAIVSGVTVKGIRGSELKKILVHRPPIKDQIKIRDFLSIYDDLISANQRRIQLLEESARLLYREWLVKLRFPGHETVPVTDGVPEGWAWEQLGDICDDIRDAVDPNELPAGTPYLSMEHMPQRSISLTDWDYAKKVGSTKLKFSNGDILFGKIRPYFHKVGIAPISGITSTDVITIRAKSLDLLPLVALIVSSDAFVAHSVATSNGTKMPRANWKVLKKWQVLVPDPMLLAELTSSLNAVLEQIQSIGLHNRSLRQARDLLLPKLMSGALDVSRINLPKEVAA